MKGSIEDPNQRSEKEIFFAALDQASPDGRAAFLDGACGKNPALRQRVDKLLADHLDAGSFMHSAAIGGKEVGGLAEVPITEGPGTTIGRYKILQKIGDGGFGVVYVAEQKEPVKRRVALKIIKLGMDTEQVVARFEAERQALAMMEHSNIARVLDGGATDTGRPYFVMELVKGVPITRYCNDNELSTRQRLELFIPVCHAIQHAHQKGIIHRDIKPSNVMITLHDGQPVPKVIDFGIAKATQQELTEKTIFTQYSQFIGTPAYMSPEQAEMSGLDIDTRSDIYSLGVLLYELLVGRTPLDAKELMSGGWDEIRRKIKEQDPPKPSTGLSTFEGSDRTSVAKQRKLEPKQLGSHLRGDLDNIVLKSLEKDRTRRYETANGFALDIQRFLKSEPISAVAPSVLYRFRKFARRNKLAFGSAIAIVTALVAGLGITLVFYTREKAAHADADTQRLTADKLKEEADRARENAEGKEKEAREARVEAEAHLAKLRLQAYQTDMLLASHAHQAGNIGYMKPLAEAHWPVPGEKDLRGFEWYHWWKAGRLHLERGWFGPIHELEISPTGSLYAARDWHSTILVNRRWPDHGKWPGDTSVQEIKPGMGGCAIAFTPDGSSLVVGYPKNGRLRVYDTKTWDFELIDVPGGGGIRSFAWSPTDDVVATGGTAGRILLWDSHTWALIGPPIDARARSAIWDLNFARDGRTLWTAMDDSTVEVWDVENRSAHGSLVAHEGAVKRVVASPANDFFVTGGMDRTVRLWSMDRELIKTYDVSGPVEDLRFSKDGKMLVAATALSNSVLVWIVKPDPPALELYREIKGHTGRVNAADFAPQKNIVIATSDDYTTNTWDLDHCEPFERLAAVRDAVQVEFTLNGDELMILDQQGNRHRWNFESRRMEAPDSQQKDFRRLALSNEGLFQAGLTANGCVEVRDFHGTSAWVSSRAAEQVAPEPAYQDGKLFTVSANGETVAWKRPDGVGVWRKDRSEAMHIGSRADFSPVLSANGQRLAVHDSNTTRVFDLAGELPALVCQVQGDGPNRCAAFSPDGAILAVGIWKHNAIYLYDTDTGFQRDTLMGHHSLVFQLAFSNDGSRLVSCDDGEMLGIWDPVTGRLLSVLKSLPNRIRSIAWSSDDRSIAILNSEGIAKVWRSPTDEEVNQSIWNWSERAGHYSAQGDLEKARLLLDEGLRHNPDDAHLLEKRRNLSQITSVLVPPKARWHWLHPVDGIDPAESDPDFHSTFSSLGFDDSSWNTGQDREGRTGGFGYGDFWLDGVDIGTPRDGTRGRTAYFRSRFTTSKTHASLALHCRRDDGIIVYLDGIEVGRDNMREGEDAFALPAAGAVTAEAENKVLRLPLNNVSLPAGEHVLAISVHNPEEPSSDLRIGEITLVGVGTAN